MVFQIKEVLLICTVDMLMCLRHFFSFCFVKVAVELFEAQIFRVTVTSNYSFKLFYLIKVLLNILFW